MIKARFWAGAVFRGRGNGFCALSKRANRASFPAFPRATRDLRRGSARRCSCAARAVQETYPSDVLGGPGADFLTGVAFWSIRFSDFSGLLRRFCVAGAALRMTWPHFFVAGAVL